MEEELINGTGCRFTGKECQNLQLIRKFWKGEGGCISQGSLEEQNCTVNIYCTEVIRLAHMIQAE